MLSVLPTLHSGLGLLAMGNCSSTRQVFFLLSVTGMWCWKTRALPTTFAAFCDCTFSGEVLQEVVIFAIATFVLTSSRIFFFTLLFSYCAMHDTNLWRPLTIAIFGSFDQACILTAHSFFSSFFPYIWLYHLASGDTVQVPCLSENSPSFTCHILSLICTNLSGTNANMRDAHVAFVWFVCMFNVLLIYPR